MLKRYLKLIIFSVWPLILFVHFSIVSIANGLMTLITGGYDYGDHPIEYHPIRKAIWMFGWYILIPLIMAIILVGLIACIVSFRSKEKCFKDTYVRVWEKIFYFFSPIALVVSILCLPFCFM